MAPAANPNYVEERERCKRFLTTFASEYDPSGVKKYMEQLQDIANRKRQNLEINLDDLVEFDGDGADSLLHALTRNTRRYASLFSEAADDVMPAPTQLLARLDVFAVLMRQREEAASERDGGLRREAAQQLPASLRRRYRVYFAPGAKREVMKLREVRAKDVGHLVTVKGIVTRVGDVKPLMEVACYTCDCCGFEIYQEITGETFMPLEQCPTQQARTNDQAGQLHLQTRACKFLKFQEVKIQEMSEDVPVGHIPRTMTVKVKGDLVRQTAPGDLVEITGVFLPTPATGFRARMAGLVTNTFLEATHIKQYKKKYSEYRITDELRERIDEYARDSDIYAKLARSIAPEIYGHLDVKKALLLLMVGGVTLQQPDGMRIRGDVHVCLMGDPGVAKSQLLKHVAGLAPRAVYTTGKGSSGVGLTAAVVRDAITNEFALEGGALVLADMGICCIDEFDKMDESDRTAIHEVMEQQTVSIAKAGITTTLNARTAVLAAANPAGGRYNTKWSPQENINLPAALLSRFDLLWLILDRADADADKALAKHVLHVHQHSEHPPLGFTPLPPADLRAYVALARRKEPPVPPELTEYVAGAYAEMRQEEAASGEQAHSYTTARTLLSILRLAQALARLRFADSVAQGDVDEALRLMRQSKASLGEAAEKARRGGAGVDPLAEIYSIIRNFSERTNSMEVDAERIKRLLAGKGFGDDVIARCIEEYSDLGVWSELGQGGVQFAVLDAELAA